MTEYLIKLSDRGRHLDITAKLKEILSQCKNDDEKTICFEKGEYHFYPDFADREVVYCSNTDSHRFPEKSIAINIDKEKNLTLEGTNGVREMQVTFEEAVPDEIAFPKKYAAENITYTPEVHISGCNFTLIPTRGILCTTRRKTVIENNIFDGMTMSSIYLSNDCNDWYESGAIRDMTIRNNKFIVRKGPNPQTVNHAIFIEPIVADKKNVKKCIHRNITIENNEFNMEASNVVCAHYTENLIIRNNKINSENYEGKFEAFVFDGCENVICENNG